MPEPADMIVPMLQRIQADLTEVKRDVKGLDGRMVRLEERFESLAPYITYTVGLHTQDRLDIERHDGEIVEIKRRLDALESERT
jgi:hypothetical protein